MISVSHRLQQSRALFLLFGGATLLCVLIHSELLPVRVSEEIDPFAIHPGKGHAYYVRANVDGPTDRLSSLLLFEDGVSLGPHIALHDRIREKGEGRYSHWSTRVYFASSDNSDPRRNGRNYQIEYAWQVPVVFWLLSLVGLLLFGAPRLKGALIWAHEHPAQLALLLFVLALAFRVSIAVNHWDDSFGGHLVKGMPYSDARGWDALATDFSQGGQAWKRSQMQWGARRPFYYIFIGALYALGSPSLTLVRIVQILLGALGAVLIFDLVRRLSDVRLGILAALAHAFLYYDARSALSTMTESLGYFLTTLFLWTLVLALERDKLRLYAGAGALLALANLTRPLNLLVGLVLPLVLLLVLGRKGRKPALVFVMGVGLALAPWVIRQQVTHGISTLSENTAEMLYAATSPDYGVWDGRVSKLPGTSETKKRVVFYNAGIRENLRQHTRWYLTHAMSFVGKNTVALTPARWLFFAACVLLAIGASARQRWVALAAAVLSLWLPLWVFAAAGGLLALIERDRMSVVAVSAVVTVFSLGIMAIDPSPRFSSSLVWQVDLLAFFFLWRIAALKSPGAAAWGGSGRYLRHAATAACLLFVVGLSIALVRHLQASKESPREEGSQWIAAIANHGLYDSVAERLVAQRVSLRSDYVIYLAGGEDVAHWSPLFSPRNYGFTVIDTVPPLRGAPRGDLPVELHGVFAGRLEPIDGPIWVIGVEVTRPWGSSLEIVAYVVDEELRVPQNAELHAADLTNEI